MSKFLYEFIMICDVYMKINDVRTNFNDIPKKIEFTWRIPQDVP